MVLVAVIFVVVNHIVASRGLNLYVYFFSLVEDAYWWSGPIQDVEKEKVT